MICSKCKTELPEDCQFCPKCGKRISSKSNINKKNYSGTYYICIAYYRHFNLLSIVGKRRNNKQYAY